MLPSTSLIILGSDFLDTYFVVLHISDSTITSHCTNYTLTTSLTHDPVHDKHLAKVVAPAATEVSYKLFQKEMEKNTLT